MNPDPSFQKFLDPPLNHGLFWGMLKTTIGSLRFEYEYDLRILSWSPELSILPVADYEIRRVGGSKIETGKIDVIFKKREKP